MELIKPQFGLIFWMAISFLVLIFLLAKFAFPIILKSLKEREDSITNALNSAEKAKKEMAALQADNEKLLVQARAERDTMLKEARDTKDAIVAEAKNKAQAEANKILATTRETINTEKNAAITELKNQVAAMSIEIAEKILRQELSNDEKQKALMDNLMKDISLN
ncbi:MAG TPA: F0F1 ATP synthase subunit B [Bacteroidia bacterium]|jgi:F-type H+-transporting ATPase subunit b|nr:F0F1 ATP synthase subunit B [Bacteroidota bacterium]MBK7432313.1 F0F1 ATP synthase subunit B [Bacteroidota bacterium]MBK7573486.1 F0F1 ATP synthase subunit B [Bacteroidota bacterium]MBK8584303.1 F0F1 ATP synthase subunit B [Bacteroidota bacterium]HQV98746.1 F0F1 ATP synthase subunit B [Bacteroidia bacterium]